MAMSTYQSIIILNVKGLNAPIKKQRVSVQIKQVRPFCLKVKVTQSCPTPCHPVDYSPPGSSVHGDSPGKKCPLPGLLPIQGSNTGLLHCRQILYHLSHQGSPRMLKWITFSRGSSWPRNWTRVSCIAAGFFTSWACLQRLTSELKAQTDCKWGDKGISCKQKQESELAILILYKTDFKTRLITKGKERHF